MRPIHAQLRYVAGVGLAALTVALGVTSAAAPLAAQVQLEVAADGRKVIHNLGGRAVSRSRQSRPQLAVRRTLPQADLDEIVGRYSSDRQLDPKLVLAVIQVESSGDPGALSRKGAMGLMQLMPETARELGVADPYDPRQNVRGGCSYLRRMLDTFDGDLELALASYNAGPSAVRRFGGIPPYEETRRYVEKVVRLYRGDAGFTLPSSAVRSGRRTYLSRDDEGRILITTNRPTR